MDERSMKHRPEDALILDAFPASSDDDSEITSKEPTVLEEVKTSTSVGRKRETQPLSGEKIEELRETLRKWIRFVVNDIVTHHGVRYLQSKGFETSDELVTDALDQLGGKYLKLMIDIINDHRTLTIPLDELDDDVGHLLDSGKAKAA